MKRSHLLGLSLLAVAPAILTCCVSSIDLEEVLQETNARERKLLPETEWNKLGIWQRIAKQPATYIPQGYGVSAPRGENDGRWFVDQRDGKRLFVPKAKVGDFSTGMLEGEATKIVGQGSHQYVNTVPGIIMMP